MITVTGRPLSVNGTTDVPIGLFGVHATALDAQRIADWGITSVRTITKQPDGIPRLPEQTAPGLVHQVECFYDRYQPALVLSDPQWERTLTDLATRYGGAARTTGRVHLLEFWNEPYLNWSCKPGVNYDGRLYDLTQAVDGGPVTIRGQSQPTEHLHWKRGLLGHDASTGEVNHVLAGYAPRGLKAGDTYPIRGLTYEMREVWMAYDPTQEHYWAGSQNELWYRRMFHVFATALKAANPQVQLAGGWGFNFWNEEWACWHRLIRPLIDAELPNLDALHEHHYGGDTRLVAAAYEVATAYTDERGRRLQFWNTEAGGMLDPERPDTPKSGVEGTSLEKAVGAMTYMLRDLIHLLDICPDKARTRAAHQAELNGGDEFAFRLLKPLRGGLIACNGGSAEHWCVSSLDGDRLAVVLFNDGRLEDDVPVQVMAPPGTILADAIMLGTQIRSDRNGLELTQNVIPLEAGPTWQGEVRLPTKAARTIVFRLAGTPAPAVPVNIEQCFAPGILADVAAGGRLERIVHLPADRLATATRARVKLVVSGQAADSGLTVNGHAYPMPTGTWTLRCPIDLGHLTPHTVLSFSAGATAYRLLMASIELIHD